MRFFLTQRQELIANKVAQIPGMKRLLAPIYEPYKQLLHKLRNRNFKRYAIEMMEQFDKCMNDNGYHYALAFGSMLGAVREHDMIAHDMDIDVTMWYDEYTPKLEEDLKRYGFRLRHTFQVEGGTKGREDTYVYKDVSIDIYYIYPPMEKFPYCSGSWEKMEGSINTVDSMRKFGRIKSKRIGIPMQRETKLVPFNRLMLPIPINAQEILEFFYGKTYMVPNPQWADEDSPVTRIPWETGNITYEEYEG